MHASLYNVRIISNSYRDGHIILLLLHITVYTIPTYEACLILDMTQVVTDEWS